MHVELLIADAEKTGLNEWSWRSRPHYFAQGDKLALLAIGTAVCWSFRV